MPDKHEVGGSSPLGPTKQVTLATLISLPDDEVGRHKLLTVIDLATPCLNQQMFIENRINKRNETDSCILRKTCY